MDSADVIVLDSSDDEESHSNENRKKGKKTEGLHKRKAPDNVDLNNEHTKKIKRIKPLTLSNKVDLTEITKNDNNFGIENNFLTENDFIEHIKKTTETEENNDDVQLTENNVKELQESSEQQTINERPHHSAKTEMNLCFRNLLDACRKADKSSDMELLINKKLIRYYESVHPDFVNSKSFRKNVESVTKEINQSPGLVYLKITGIIEELKIRRKSVNCVIANEAVTTTGNEKRDNQIKRLNKALYILKKRIAKLEETEVDFDEDNDSSYLAVERYKKRAWQIYEKICDITGESKHAQRSVRKPISFHGTVYPEFNKAIQTFVNRTNTFPDFVDVLKCLEYCNKQYNFKLKNEEMKKIAEDAFIKIGKQLQNRRQTDLYETVTYYIGTEKDPAFEDSSLQSKLVENKKFHTRISDIIDQFAEQQETTKENSVDESERILGKESHDSNNIEKTKFDNNNDENTNIIRESKGKKNEEIVVLLDDENLSAPIS